MPWEFKAEPLLLISFSIFVQKIPSYDPAAYPR